MTVIDCDIVIEPRRVFYRDESGRFTAAIERGVRAGLEDVGKLGVAAAEGIAGAHDRGGGYATSFYSEMRGAVQVIWSSHDPKAMLLEGGAPPHAIGLAGQILANREEGFGPVRGPVEHPGFMGFHTLRRSYEMVKNRTIGLIAAHVG